MLTVLLHVTVVDQDHVLYDTRCHSASSERAAPPVRDAYEDDACGHLVLLSCVGGNDGLCGRPLKVLQQAGNQQAAGSRIVKSHPCSPGKQHVKEAECRLAAGIN